MTSTLPLTNLHDLAEILGPMPPGDAPVAWWVSVHPDVLAGWEKYLADRQEWQAAWSELLTVTGLPSGTRTKIVAAWTDTVIGLIPPPGVTVPAGMRRNAQGHLVPRKRSRAERHSRVSQLFDLLSPVPTAVHYLPGIPSALYTDEKVYSVVVRKPAQAVLAFLGHDPDQVKASQWQVGPQWERLKVSTFHMLRERGEG